MIILLSVFGVIALLCILCGSSASAPRMEGADDHFQTCSEAIPLGNSRAVAVKAEKLSGLRVAGLRFRETVWRLPIGMI